MHEQILPGGVANASRVVRVGAHVLRPSNAHSRTIHGVLRDLRSTGFLGAPEPIGIDEDDRERLVFIDGDVPIPPYPVWAQRDEALTSIVGLMKDLHDASTLIDLHPGGWSREMADPSGGPVLCHNDVCLENVVFRDGRAIALLDFDFAAPGRRVFDLASLARMSVPIDDDVNADRLGWRPADRPARLRLVADAYGLDGPQRTELVGILDDSIQRGGEFVRRRVEAGDPGFVTMWAEMGGSERFDRRRRWWAEQRRHFEHAMR